jgi:hypothetical protein
VAHRFFTNLDLHEDVPLRARPRIGEWGGAAIPTTGGKKAVRVIVPILFLLALTAVLTLGYFVFRTIAQAVGL